ncbi:MAG TPA: polyprenol monophosphomannose synthase [Myxococcota bacterium]|nr:polyprenol monophosphomannose synthase [Myxococcota bacterium]
MTPRTLVILPTYNEAPNVLDLSREILATGNTVDVLVVDDSSPDGTGELVARAAQTESRLRLLTRPRKLGLGTAYLAGFRFALEHGYDCAITMDCDRSHNPRYLPEMLAAMEQHDLVIGSRYAPGGGILNWPRRRILLSAFANGYARVLLRLPIRDCTSGFRCYRRVVLETVDPWSARGSGYSFLEEMAWRVHRCGFRIGEIPILFEQRVAGKSKIDSSEIYRAAWHVLATALHPPTLRRAEAPASAPRQVSSRDGRNIA